MATETMRLPSGGEIDLIRPDFRLCRTLDDYMEVKYAINERIIDIELQIDLYESGCNPKSDPTWLPRTRAALKWAKLYRDEAQNRQGRLSSIEKQKAHATLERNVIDVIKALLPPKDFDALVIAAKTLKASRTENVETTHEALSR